MFRVQVLIDFAIHRQKKRCSVYEEELDVQWRFLVEISFNVDSRKHRRCQQHIEKPEKNLEALFSNLETF